MYLQLTTLITVLKAIDKDLLKLSDSSLTKVILYGDSEHSDIQNHDILNSTSTYILDSKRLACSLLQCKAPLSIYSKTHAIFLEIFEPCLVFLT